MIDPEAKSCDLPAGLTIEDGLLHLQNVQRPMLLAYVTRLLKGDAHRAEDIVQETFLRAWQNPDARNAEGRWNRAWLLTVARRIAIDYVRTVAARPREMSDEYLDVRWVEENGIERLFAGVEVREALGTLPPRSRAALEQIYFHERSAVEAAAVLQVVPGTVRSRTFYALRALRTELENRGYARKAELEDPAPAGL